jgi:anaerobic selenocysteine-containing dehydrogenase
MAVSHRSICRTCHNMCAVVVETDEGRVVSVTGDRDDPVFHGYTCNKGRAHPVLYDHPERLRTPLRRTGESREPIDMDQAMTEVAARLGRILDEHGPRAVALYSGTYAYVDNPANFTMIDAFMRAIDSPMTFTSASIDQSGKPVAEAMHGKWMAPGYASHDPEAVLFVAKNPLVSHLAWSANPGDFFKELSAREGALIVIDPRRTETARRATVHLQPLPGHDAALLAAMIRVILDESLADQDFLDANATGVDDLKAAVAPFAPGVVAPAAGVPVADLVRAARLYAGASRGFTSAGTGANMTGDATLIEYLLLCLQTICGHWLREGESVRNALTVMPAYAQAATAQALPPFPGYGYGEPSRIRGLGQTAYGMPTATAAEEVLLDGPGQVRALLSVGGNPVAAWPDQEKTAKAISQLDVLVQTDVVMSATAKVADYVFAMKLPYEQPGTTFISDLNSIAMAGAGARDSYGRYTPALVEAPPQTLDLPTFIFKLAQAMGLQLDVYPATGANIPGGTPVSLDMSTDLDLERLFSIVHSGSRIPLDRLRHLSGGAMFPDPPVVVAPKDPGWEGRLDLANPDMMSDLRAVSERDDDRAGFPFRLISRRMPHLYNSPTVSMPANRPRHNPAFMNPDDLQRLDAEPGDIVELRSPHATIDAVVEADPSVRCGTVSMSHAWGDHPDAKDPVPGACTARLVDNADVYDRYTGQPQMSNIPVTVSVKNSAAAGTVPASAVHS